MLSNIYWIVAILTMLVLLGGAIYNLVTQIKNDREFKKFKQRQWETLKALETDINTKRKGDK